jgi:glutaredoxin 3
LAAQAGGLSARSPDKSCRANAILFEVMSQITVYTTDPCSFCARVKGLLSARGLEFSEVNLTKDPAGRVELARRTGMMSFPQVLVDENLLGGYAEVQRAADDGRLDDLLPA